ncbi:MAG: hypothetical protein SF029_04810 [bacterium]|nr:hypothetical protein [bacterium]
MEANRPPQFWLALILFCIVAALNLAALFSVFDTTGADPEDIDQTEGSAAPSTVDQELAEDVGGLSQVTGIPNGLLALVMAGLVVALLFRVPWAVMASMIALAFDAILKAIIILTELASGTPITDLWLSIVIIVVDVLAIYLFNQSRPKTTPLESNVQQRQAMR